MQISCEVITETHKSDENEHFQSICVRKVCVLLQSSRRGREGVAGGRRLCRPGDCRRQSEFGQHRQPGQGGVLVAALRITARFPQVSPGREPVTQDGGVQDPARRAIRGRDLEAMSPECRCELEAKRWSRTPGVNLKMK